MLDVSDLTSLPKGQAFVYKNGGELWKVRFPIFNNDRIDLPVEVDALVAEMKKHYQTCDDWGKVLANV